MVYVFQRGGVFGMDFLVSFVEIVVVKHRGWRQLKDVMFLRVAMGLELVVLKENEWVV